VSRKTYTPTFLAAWREHLNLSQEEVAPDLGISAGHLSNIERGKRPYTQELLEAAARRYGCKPADLLSVDPRDPPSRDELLEAADGLTPQQRADMAKMMRALAERHNDNFDADELPEPAKARRAKG
jgi:transcriptional regulator with XRE-family HTH domain